MAEPAAWAWLAILGIVIGFEWWAVATGSHTLSQWLWKHRIAKWLGVIGLSAFLIHMFATKEGSRDPQVYPVLCGLECENE